MKRFYQFAERFYRIQSILMLLTALVFTDQLLFAQTWSTASSCAGTSTSVVVTTSMILGSNGSYSGSSDDDKTKAFDGAVLTFFDAPNTAPNGQWVGLDLGSARNITCIKFRPRDQFPARMNGGQFQVATTADFASPTTIYTTNNISTFTDYYLTSSGQSIRYIRYLSPNNGYGNIAEITLYEGAIPTGTSSLTALTNNLSLSGNKLVGSPSSTKGITIDNNGNVVADSNIVANSFKASPYRSIPDYVFKEKYQLKSLSEVSDYIKHNQHLPEIPSENEYRKRGNVDLAELSFLLLKKIEELTLYSIEMHKWKEKIGKQIENFEATARRNKKHGNTSKTKK